jgi:hypothetical protein
LIAAVSIPLLAMTHAITEFEFHISPSHAHRNPTQASGLAGRGREPVAHGPRRCSIATGCPRPRRCPELVRRATAGSRIGRSEVGLPSDCQRDLPRRLPAASR